MPAGVSGAALALGEVIIEVNAVVEATALLRTRDSETAVAIFAFDWQHLLAPD